MFNYQKIVIKKWKYFLKTESCYRKMCKNHLAIKNEWCYGKLTKGISFNDPMCLNCKHFYKNVK